jgi:hypothetical protein
MIAKQWIRVLKTVRTRARKTSPRTRQIAAVSFVVTLSVAGIVIVANQTSPSASAASAAVKPAATVTKAGSTSARSATAKSTTAKPTNAKPANAATSSAQTEEVVTIAGCLEQSHDTFRLKDTAGSDAPKSRNWKTGFLTKHASSVTIVDSGGKLKLGSHVGERVSVTGMLSDKEMQGRSLKTLDIACE